LEANILLEKIEPIFISFEKIIEKKDPIKILTLGYLTYMIIGFFMLMLPFSTDLEVSWLDNLFIAVSAVSTTGLATVGTGSSYSFFGELVILILIQLGGIGYMTFGSFIILQTGHRISSTRAKMTRTAFPLPETFSIVSFLRGVIVFTVGVEIIGAVLLSYFFWTEGFENPIWSGIFHSISSFCTAGFSLNPDSFESLRDHVPINLILSVLSLCGAVGFIVAVDLWERMRGRRQTLLFTSKVILLITSTFLAGGTLLISAIETSIQNLPLGERILTAFFQTMTATSTVGFNTVSIGNLGPDTIMLIYFLMIFGASPSGTGGGLKSTTFSALYGLVKSTLKRNEVISFLGRKIPPKRLQLAASSFVFCAFIVGLSVFILSATENAPFDKILFEAISALGTVGLSMGLTGDLTSIGKWVVIGLMVIGRVGVLTFGLAVSTTGEVELIDGDCDLVI